MSNRHSQSQPSNPLVDSLISGDRRVGGILCNDRSGLCLSSAGAIDSSNSGVYTNLVRLATQLQQQGKATDSTPLITIETYSSAIIVKEYDGHAVALKVPSASPTEVANGDEAGADAAP
jgi:hypothetical protein